MRDLARFVVVGSIGFAVDGGLLLLLMDSGVSVFLARLASFSVAVSVTWALNRAWTFSSHRVKKSRRAYVDYFVGQTVGAGINFAVFFLSLLLFPALKQYPLVPFAMGSGVALIFNFLVAKHIVFRSERV